MFKRHLDSNKSSCTYYLTYLAHYYTLYPSVESSLWLANWWQHLLQLWVNLPFLSAFPSQWINTALQLPIILREVLIDAVSLLALSSLKVGFVFFYLFLWWSDTPLAALDPVKCRRRGIFSKIVMSSIFHPDSSFQFCIIRHSIYHIAETWKSYWHTSILTAWSRSWRIPLAEVVNSHLQDVLQGHFATLLTRTVR